MIQLLERLMVTVDVDQRGAVGWLVVGVLLGIALVVFGIIKFLIPGE